MFEHALIEFKITMYEFYKIVPYVARCMLDAMRIGRTVELMADFFQFHSYNLLLLRQILQTVSPDIG